MKKFLNAAKLSPTKLKYLRWVSYVAAYLLVFVVFAYVSFPYERLRQYVVSSYNAASVGSDSRLEIDSLTWSWRFPGIVAEGVRLVVTPPALPEGDKPPAPRSLEAQEIFVSGSPLALISGAREASFGAHALEGEIYGFVSDSEASRRFDLQLDQVNPGAVPQLASAIGLPLSGRLSGSIKLELPEANLSKAEGTVELTAEDLVLGDGKAKIQGLLELPELHMGVFKLKGEVAAGRLKLDECVAQGRDADLSLVGSVRLRQKFENSIADLDLKFSFSEKYKTQSDLTKALFGQADSKVPGLFDTATSTALAKQDDGSYAARLSGPLYRLKPKPPGGKRSTAKSAVNSRRRALGKRKAAQAGEDAAEAADDTEANENEGAELP